MIQYVLPHPKYDEILELCNNVHDYILYYKYRLAYANTGPWQRY